MNSFSEKNHFKKKNRESFYIVSTSLIVFFILINRFEMETEYYLESDIESEVYQGFCGTTSLMSNDFDNLPVFKNNCSSCRFYSKDMTGPALKGSVNRLGPEYFVLYITKQDSLLKSGDSVANQNIEEWQSGWRHRDPLTEIEIQLLLSELSK